jgi:hypothetical protein
MPGLPENGQFSIRCCMVLGSWSHSWQRGWCCTPRRVRRGWRSSISLGSRANGFYPLRRPWLPDELPGGAGHGSMEGSEIQDLAVYVPWAVHLHCRGSSSSGIVLSCVCPEPHECPVPNCCLVDHWQPSWSWHTCGAQTYFSQTRKR